VIVKIITGRDNGCDREKEREREQERGRERDVDNNWIQSFDERHICIQIVVIESCYSLPDRSLSSFTILEVTGTALLLRTTAVRNRFDPLCNIRPV
jgi:hypothetical protein